MGKKKREVGLANGVRELARKFGPAGRRGRPERQD